MKDGIPGYVSSFQLRQGGYINFQYHSEYPPANDPKYMLTEEKTKAMLADANAWIQKYFPWTEDFAVFQLRDGTIRLDASRQGFLG